MRRGARQRRLKDPYNINRTFRINESQARTIQMFTERFELLSDGESLRYMVEAFMVPMLRGEIPFKKVLTSMSELPPLAKRPAMSPQSTEPQASSDDGFLRPPINIAGKTAVELDEDGEELSQEEKMRRSRAKPAMDAEEAPRWSSLRDEV
jgi:hypothetical protein